jgi:DNA-sulfur modification-associated
MTMTITEELDLSAGQYVKGILLAPTIFIASTNFKQLKTITRNPVLLQPGARRGPWDADELEAEADIHALIQRALSGNKKSNVSPYRAYIEDVVMGKAGVLPPMHLWSPNAITIARHGTQTYALVPNGEHLLAIDGETQLTAHWTLDGSASSPELRDAHRDFPLAAIIHHGIDHTVARQYFHDLNVLAVRPNTSLGLSMDTKDPIMRLVSDLETKVPFLLERVEKMARQLPKHSNKVVTLQSLRQMVVNVAKGISGVQYGARPAPVDEIDLNDLKQVATSWVGAYMNTFEREIADRETYLAGAGPVLAAVGAMGQTLLLSAPDQRPATQERLLDSLRQVDWKKGDHWIGIAGAPTSTGVFSVKGTKEVAYAVFNALTDPDNGSYARIRPGTGPFPSPIPEWVKRNLYPATSWTSGNAEDRPAS